MSFPPESDVITYPGGTNVTETYDLRSRLIQVNDGGSAGAHAIHL